MAAVQLAVAADPNRCFTVFLVSRSRRAVRAAEPGPLDGRVDGESRNIVSSSFRVRLWRTCRAGTFRLPSTSSRNDDPLLLKFQGDMTHANRVSKTVQVVNATMTARHPRSTRRARKDPAE